jgi:lipopolysaccharide heptosyltransferase II
MLTFVLMKILIIRFSSIGDIVLTSPVMRCIKKQLPHATIHYLTKQSFKGIIEANPYVAKIHLLNDDFDALIPELRAENFDFIIDLHKNLRTLKVKRALSKVKAYSFNKLNIEKWLLTNFHINKMPKVHIVDRYVATAKPLGVINDYEGLDYFIPAHEYTNPSDIPTSHQAGYIGLVIGASFATKKLPTTKLIELCKAIHHPIILLGGPEDKEIGDQIATNDPQKIYNASGKFTLNESADLVRTAKVIISHDTGLMHIAAAFKKKVISLWGSTAPVLGMTPYYGKYTIDNARIQVPNLSCQPCTKIGNKKCPKGHFKCMNDINITDIVQQVERLLK